MRFDGNNYDVVKAMQYLQLELLKNGYGMMLSCANDMSTFCQIYRANIFTSAINIAVRNWDNNEVQIDCFTDDEDLMSIVRNWIYSYCNEI